MLRYKVNFEWKDHLSGDIIIGNLDSQWWVAAVEKAWYLFITSKDEICMPWKNMTPLSVYIEELK